MESLAVLLIGSGPACAAAAAALAASPIVAGHGIRTAADITQALDVLKGDAAIGVTLFIWDGKDPTELPGIVALIQKHQRNPLMAVAIRSTAAVPQEVAARLWDAGVADCQFTQPLGDVAEALAIALREVVRHRAHFAVAAASARLARCKDLRELAALALRILDEQAIGRRGAMFCYQRNTSGPQLLAITGTGQFAAVDCTPIDDLADDEARSLVRDAWTGRTTRFGHNLAALHIDTPSRTHPALILLALDAPLLPWQKRLLESFADAIAPAVEESQLAQQLIRTQRAMISTLATLAEYKDTDTGEHVARVARITAEIASFLQQSSSDSDIDADFLDHIGHASILHDLGKVAMPEHVLLKRGPLDASERAVINSHVVIGHEMLKKAAALTTHGEARLFRLASEIALSHHERYDGTGYPRGLKGDEIPLSARIVAVVDVFDALISQRPYKEPWSVESALDLIRRESGRHFDPRVVEAFLAVQERKASAKFILWTEAMSVGHAELDRDHQRLIGILNHLGINVELGNRHIVEFILEDLADYAQVHFRREEQHLQRLNFPELERHGSIHDAITRRIEDAKWKYLQGFSATLHGELLTFLTSWLNHHILVEDMKYRHFAASADGEESAAVAPGALDYSLAKLPQT